MHAYLGNASPQISATLFVGQEDDSLGRTRNEPSLYQKLTMLEIGVQTAFAHTTIVWLTNGLVMRVNHLTLCGWFYP